MTARGLLGRTIARLTGSTQLERLTALEEKVGKFGRAQRDELAVQRGQLDQLRDAVATRASVDAMKAIDRRLEALQTSLARQDRALSDALERAGRFDEQAVDDRRFARRIEALQRRDRPIIVGPWTGEVGFELLYWIPFVRWTVTQYGLDPSRLTVVSRGGTASWYGTLAARYVDIFSLVTTEEFRAATEDAKKQRRVGEFDARIVARVRAMHALEHAELLHPGMMYRLFNPFWKELATVARIDAYTEYARLGEGPAEAGLHMESGEGPANADVESGFSRTLAQAAMLDLPDDYIAARFYFSECFPDTPANRAFVASTIDAVSRHSPIVLLNAPFAVDDHRDVAQADANAGLDEGNRGRVISIADRMAPETNLALQTAVIAGARAFIGTYGGYSYLAPFHGVSAIAFYSARTFKPHHLHLAHRVFERLGGAGAGGANVTALDVAELPLLQLALAAGGTPPGRPAEAGRRASTG